MISGGLQEPAGDILPDSNLRHGVRSPGLNEEYTPHSRACTFSLEQNKNAALATKIFRTNFAQGLPAYKLWFRETCLNSHSDAHTSYRDMECESESERIRHF